MKKVHFIDCGANIGNATDWAIDKYKERLIKVDAFEPEYINYTHMLSKYSSTKILTIHTQAIWTENEIKEFYIQYWGTRTGSSLLSDKEQIIKTGQHIPHSYTGRSLNLKVDESSIYRDENGNVFATKDLVLRRRLTKVVQCIDFSDWIFKNLSKENYNVLKVDIEGAEYKVIDHLLNTGAYEFVDEWLVEFTNKSRAPESFDQGVIDRFKSTVSNYIDWGPMGEVIMGE